MKNKEDIERQVIEILNEGYRISVKDYDTDYHHDHLILSRSDDPHLIVAAILSTDKPLTIEYGHGNDTWQRHV